MSKEADGAHSVDQEMERVFGGGKSGRREPFVPRRPGPLPGSINHDEDCDCDRCKPKFPRRTD